MKIQSRRERIRQLVGHLKKSLATLGRLKVGGYDTYYGYKCVCMACALGEGGKVGGLFVHGFMDVDA